MKKYFIFDKLLKNKIMKMKPKLFTLLIIALSFYYGCKNKQTKASFPDDNAICGIVKPLKLNPNSTTIVLQDYITEIEKIDSVSFSKGIRYELSDSLPAVYELFYNQDSIPYYSKMHIWVKGYAYTILLEKSDKIIHHYKYNPQGKEHKKVSLAGDFNDWNPGNTILDFKEGLWQTSLMLNPGIYQYLVVPDGNWIIDNNNTDTASNNMGGFNSVLRIERKYEEPLPKLYSESFKGDTLFIAYENNVSALYVFWDNFLLDSAFFSVKDNEIQILIPQEAKKINYSYIRLFSENASGKSNDLLLPLKNGEIIINSKDLTRSHKEAQIYYFLMTDRFNNADKENDAPINDPEVATLANFMGGDLKGITQKIKEGYFDNLNISTIWLSPVVQNPDIAYNEYPAPHKKFSGYHGYWPVNSAKIDRRFGTDDCLHELVKAAHSRNINVILDYVANHVHEDNPLIKNNPHWATEIDLGTDKNIRKWDEHRLTTWFDTFLPSLDFSNKEVIDTIAAIGIYWVNKFDLDGFRHDATKHIPHEFWRAMTLSLKKQIIQPKNKQILQIGETFGSRELIGSYVGSGLLDGQFDFNLYFDARAVFAKDDEPFTKASNALDQSFRSYGYNSLMGNITGNHDLPRFTSLASGDLKFEENAKEVAWKRKIEITDTSGYCKMALFMAFNLTIPGIPVIYYGDEIGMAGADDPDNRRMMKFENLSKYELELKGNIEKLSRLKRNSMALNYGHFEWLETNDKVLVYARKYFNETVIVILNKDKTHSQISFKLPKYLNNNDLKAAFNSNFVMQNDIVTVSVKSFGFEILTNNK